MTKPRPLILAGASSLSGLVGHAAQLGRGLLAVHDAVDEVEGVAGLVDGLHSDGRSDGQLAEAAGVASGWRGMRSVTGSPIGYGTGDAPAASFSRGIALSCHLRG